MRYLILIVLFSSCNLFRHETSSTNNKAEVKKESSGSVRVDSNGTTSDKTYTKETVYYQPIKDTTNNNIHITTPAPIIRIIETGRERVQQTQVIRDTSWKDAFNSLQTLIANKEVEKKVKVGPSFIEWLLIAGLALLLLKNFLPFKLIKV